MIPFFLLDADMTSLMKEITPYAPIVWGLLTLLGYWLWWQERKEKKSNNEKYDKLFERSIEVIIKLDLRMESSDRRSEKIDEILSDVKNLISKVE